MSSRQGGQRGEKSRTWPAIAIEISKDGANLCRRLAHNATFEGGGDISTVLVNSIHQRHLDRKSKLWGIGVRPEIGPLGINVEEFRGKVIKPIQTDR